MLSERVMWTQGMGVSPVHLQQQDRYMDVQLRLREAMLWPHAWGFTEFDIDEHYLTFGKFVLKKAKGIFPDGTLFEIGNNQQALSLDIPQGLNNAKIVLALPMTLNNFIETRDESNHEISTRYIRSPVKIRDHNAYKDKNNSDVLIFCGRLDLRLMIDEGSNLSDYVTMPVALVAECRQDKNIILDKEFTPTFLHIEASPTLTTYLREIIGLLTNRADHLANRISNSGQNGSAELGDFMLLQCINRAEPLFKHFDNTSGLHPENFYQLLLSLVAELATFFERKKRPSQVAAYDHGAQYRSFADLMGLARFALSMVLEQHAVLLPIQQRKNNVMLAPIHDKKLLSTAFFVLVVQADMDQESLRSLLPKQIKIGTPENIRELVNTHLPGVKILPLAVAPRQIPFHAGKSYFQLDFTSIQRAQLEASTGCAFHVSGTFPALQLQLWAIKE